MSGAGPVYLCMPLGAAHGWGIYGKSVALELAKRSPTRLITNDLDPVSVPDELERRELTALAPAPEELACFLCRQGFFRLDGPLLQLVDNPSGGAARPSFRGAPTVGCVAFEHNLLAQPWVANLRGAFDRVVTTCSWCTRTLYEHGVASAVTVLPGVDGRLFHPLKTRDRGVLRDRFVIFSGGKFEYRKGQDVVIRAVKVMMERHPDVFLVNAWHNHWAFSFDTMRMSPLIRFRRRRGASVDAIRGVLADNGIDLSRTLTVGPMPNPMLPPVYWNTDVGVFPNRCEGGINQVLVEYMACGKPAIATATTGHADVVSADNALVIRPARERLVRAGDGAPVARWPEPSLESTVENLEWAYRNREAVAAMGRRAARAMERLTWSRTARALERLLCG